jgi:hypothetical protein
MMSEEDRLSQSLSLTGDLVAQLIELLRDSEHLSSDIVKLTHQIEVLQNNQKWMLECLRDNRPNVLTRLESLETGATSDRASRKNSVTIVVAVISLVGVIALAAAKFFGS